MERRYLGRRCSRPPCIGPPVVVQRILGLPPGIGRPSVVVDSVVELVPGSRRYELSDWLGNVRVVVSDARVPVRQGGQLRGYRAEVVSVGDYYSYGGRMVERSYEVGWVYRWGFNGQEVVGELGRSHYTARFWEYDGRLGHRWEVDPRREVGYGSYVVFRNNPIFFTDPLGDTIRIKLNNQYLVYSIGMDYGGEYRFACDVVNYLNQIASTRIGRQLLSTLIASEHKYDIVDELPPKDERSSVKASAIFRPHPSGGGRIFAGLLSEDYWEPVKIGVLAHELFHGYQHEKGYLKQRKFGRIDSEVEAYLFEEAIYARLGYDITSTRYGNPTTEAQRSYAIAIRGLLVGQSFDRSLYKVAIESFKEGSVSNMMGVYNAYRESIDDDSPAIIDFYPLIRD